VAFDEFSYSATNNSAFTGGDLREVTVVAQEDLNNLEESLTEDLKKSAAAALNEKLAGKKYHEDTIEIVVKSKVFDSELDHEAALVNLDLEVEAMQAPQIETPPPAAPPPPESAAPPAPVEPGLPPPPGEEAGGGAPITSAKDPNKQSAAPNELIHAFPGKKPSYAMPNLKNYAFNMKKTAMDPKRSYSELGRFAKAPFGESVDEGTDIEEQVFRKNVSQLQRIAKEIENIDALRSISEKKTKKVFSD